MTGPCPDTGEKGLYCVYLIRCSDGTYYCGIAMDAHKRLQQHNEGKGARYTASRRPVVLEYATACRFSRAGAQSIERKAKKKPRDLKRAFLEKEGTTERDAGN